MEEKGSLIKALKELFQKSPEEEVAEFTEEITELVDEGEEKGLLSPEEGEMIVNIVQFRNVPVREVMIPRQEVVALEVNTPFKKVVEIINQEPHTRYPVYEKDLDHLLGIVHVKDLMRFCQSTFEPESLRELCREAYIVPETKKVRDLLREFRQRREQMAIVIDEMGVISGLVTLQDILQDILGEEIPSFPQDKEGWYVVRGTVRLDDLKRFLGFEFPRGNYETLSGFIIAQVGHLPRPGERFCLNGLEIEILSADNRRIKKIRFRQID